MTTMPDERAQGAPDITQLTALLKQADRLGLTWGRRPGTVANITGLFTPRQASVIMDGDDVGVTVVSLVGDLAVGDRVMVDRVPPAGLYAIAIIDDSTAPMAVASTSNTAAIIAETVVLTVLSASLRAGVAYEVQAGTLISAATFTPAVYRVRKGPSVAGTLWATGPGFSGLAGVNIAAQWIGYITPTSTMTTDVSLTLSSATAGATHIGNAQTPRYFSLRRVGSAADYPQAVPVS
jgi:hypothetical protein